MKKIALLLLMAVAITLVGCGNDEPINQNELKTNELRNKYNDKIVGSWWQERQNESVKLFEQLTFASDGSLTGYVKKQTRHKVSVGGQEVWTDWETTSGNGDLKGNWSLLWKDGKSYLNLYATINNDEEFSHSEVWYGQDIPFNDIFTDENNDTWLDIESPYWKGKDNERLIYYIYQKGTSSPTF